MRERIEKAITELLSGKWGRLAKPSIGYVAGTSGKGQVFVVPSELVKTFGRPDTGSPDGKVSGSYYFQDEQDNIVVLEDYKKTTLYYPEPFVDPQTRKTIQMPTPDELWNSDTPTGFNVASKSRAAALDFINWLHSQVKVFDAQKQPAMPW